mmetsp:Transcript_58022/g.92182  ORF Transcript_58022/g.92182 Transcript_58022/m.92182 type:complete len:233 (-) Transcript_58022:81-779(-)
MWFATLTSFLYVVIATSRGDHRGVLSVDADTEQGAASLLQRQADFSAAGLTRRERRQTVSLRSNSQWEGGETISFTNDTADNNDNDTDTESGSSDDVPITIADGGDETQNATNGKGHEEGITVNTTVENTTDNSSSIVTLGNSSNGTSSSGSDHANGTGYFSNTYDFTPSHHSIQKPSRGETVAECDPCPPGGQEKPDSSMIGPPDGTSGNSSSDGSGQSNSSLVQVIDSAR